MEKSIEFIVNRFNNSAKYGYFELIYNLYKDIHEFKLFYKDNRSLKILSILSYKYYEPSSLKAMGIVVTQEEFKQKLSKEFLKNLIDYMLFAKESKDLIDNSGNPIIIIPIQKLINEGYN